MPTFNRDDLSLSTSWLRESDSERILDQVQAAGFSRVELEYRLDPATLAGLRAGLRQRGMSVTSVHNFCPYPPAAAGKLEPSGDLFNLASADREERQLAVRYTAVSLETAADLEARAVVLHLGWVPGLGAKELTREAARRGGMTPELLAVVKARRAASPVVLDALSFALEPLLRRAGELGLVLGVENRFHVFQAPNLSETRSLLERFAGAPIGYWHDTGHAHNRELAGLNTAQTYLETLGERLVGCHLHDATGPDDHQPPGEGELNWDWLCARLLPAPIKVVELKPGPDPARVARAADHLAGAFARQARKA